MRDYKLFKNIFLSVLIFIILGTTSFAAPVEDALPSGIYAFLTVLPIIVILVLLFKKVNMLVAGFIGGGTAMVLAPLAFAAVGAIPELVAAMSIAAAVAFTTSPASLETGIIAKLAEVPANDYVSLMRPYWLIFTVIAVIIGFYGAKKRDAIFTGDEDEEMKNKSNSELFKNTIPVIFLLTAVIAGPFINKAVGFPILGPLMYTILTVALIFICTKFTLSEASDAMIDGSTYILTKLFQVGIFLTFINIIGETGAFSSIVGVAKLAPEFLVLPVTIIAGFAVGVPAGAYVGTLLTLVLPVALTLGLPLVGVAEGCNADLVLLDTKKYEDAIIDIPSRLFVITNGNIIYELKKEIKKNYKA